MDVALMKIVTGRNEMTLGEMTKNESGAMKTLKRLEHASRSSHDLRGT